MFVFISNGIMMDIGICCELLLAPFEAKGLGFRCCLFLFGMIVCVATVQ